MLSPVSYLFYFLGPVLLAVWWRWRSGAEWSFFFIGIPLFLLSQVGVVLVQGLMAAIAGVAGGQEYAKTAALIGAGIGPGLCEESCRVLGFYWLGRRGKPATWNRGIMYAIGHSGMETILVGLGILAALAAAEYMPDKLPESVVQSIDEMRQTPTWKATLLAAHRLFGGLLIHATFTSLVVLFMQRRQWRWLLAAMGLHAVNNWVAISLQSQLAHLGFLAIFTLCLIAVYGALLWWTWRLTHHQPVPTADAESTADTTSTPEDSHTP